MHVLQNLVKDAHEYLRINGREINEVDDVIEIDIEALDSRAAELGIHDLDPFFKSRLFRSNNFQVDKHRGVILKIFKQ